MQSKVLVRHDGQLRECGELHSGVWLCGFCGISTIAPIIDAHCPECHAVVTLVEQEERDA